MLVIFSILAGYCLEIKLFSYFLCFLTSYNISQPKKQGPFESETKDVYCPPLLSRFFTIICSKFGQSSGPQSWSWSAVEVKVAKPSKLSKAKAKLKPWVVSRHISYYCPLHVVFNLKKPPLYHLLHLGEGYRGHFFGKVFTIATFIFFSFLLGMWVTKLKKFFKNIQLKKIASHFQDISCFKVKVQLYIGILSLSLSLSLL